MLGHRPCPSSVVAQTGLSLHAGGLRGLWACSRTARQSWPAGYDCIAALGEGEHCWIWRDSCKHHSRWPLSRCWRHHVSSVHAPRSGHFPQGHSAQPHSLHCHTICCLQVQLFNSNVIQSRSPILQQTLDSDASLQGSRGDFPKFWDWKPWHESATL